MRDLDVSAKTPRGWASLTAREYGPSSSAFNGPGFCSSRISPADLAHVAIIASTTSTTSQCGMSITPAPTIEFAEPVRKPTFRGLTGPHRIYRAAPNYAGLRPEWFPECCRLIVAHHGPAIAPMSAIGALRPTSMLERHKKCSLRTRCLFTFGQRLGRSLHRFTEKRSDAFKIQLRQNDYDLGRCALDDRRHVSNKGPLCHEHWRAQTHMIARRFEPAHLLGVRGRLHASFHRCFAAGIVYKTRS